MVRFTVDVRAAIAVGEDPVANKQKLQRLKASKFTLLTQLVNGRKYSFNSAPLPSSDYPSFLQVAEGSRNSRQ